MAARFRVRRIAKWAGLSASALVLIVWAATVPIFTSRSFVLERVGSRDYLLLSLGRIDWATPRNLAPPNGFAIFRSKDDSTWPPWLRFGMVWPWLDRNNARLYVVIPLWLPFLI